MAGKESVLCSEAHIQEHSCMWSSCWMPGGRVCAQCSRVICKHMNAAMKHGEQRYKGPMHFPRRGACGGGGGGEAAAAAGGRGGRQ